MRREIHLDNAAVWGWPTALGCLITIGLVSALFSDGGFGDLLAAVCLGVPVVASLWFGWLRQGGGGA